MTTETKHMPSEREIEAVENAIYDACHPEHKGMLRNLRDEGQAEIRKMAIAALTAASQVRAPDQSKRVRELEAARGRVKRLENILREILERTSVGEPLRTRVQGTLVAAQPLLWTPPPYHELETEKRAAAHSRARNRSRTRRGEEGD